MNELPITGYLNRLSARPGELLEARISVQGGGRYRTRLVRVISADPNPDGPGLQLEDLSSLHETEQVGHRQRIRLGSFAEAPGPSIASDKACWTALVMPSMAQSSSRVVLHHAGDAASLTLRMGAGKVEAALETGQGSCVAEVPGRLRHDRWHRIWASLDTVSGRLLVGFHTPSHLYEPAESRWREVPAFNALMPSGGILRLAAATPGAQDENFNGKIEDPAILASFRAGWSKPFETIDELSQTLICAWNLGIGIDTQHIASVGGQSCDGTLTNLPMRGVVGARWTGTEQSWRHAPTHYAAIKFHEDDLGDCGWECSFEFLVPEGLKSGSYALHLSCEDGEDWIPFYVLPPRDGPRPKVVFLAPTFTYQAYGNHALGWTNDVLRARMAQWRAYPYTPDDFPIYGRCTYNHHPDGSGIAYASRARPILTMRPGFLTFSDRAPGGSGVRHYASDSHLLGWLEAEHIEFDVITDEDLHDEGVDLLARYRVLLTGGHPEYHTSETLDALQAHVLRGGRLCYLGGNGFYWRIGRSPSLPWAVEVRRAEGGVRAWAAEPGEYYHALDGKFGGLWKRNRRDPQQVALTGFSTQGRYESAWFRRTEESRDPSVAWIFEGVDGQTFGDYGLNSGGAAGYELDRADPRLGTPDGAIVIARSEGLQSSFLPLMEDMRFPPQALTGEDAGTLVRGDMTYFETEDGGAVFAASSISFNGSLWKDGSFGGPVSRILENVVRHFSREAGASIA
jgi:N,N-dimethylformamidase